MSSITAEQVRDLRNQTGSGIMDCKNALTESEGDFEKAIDFLRKKGLAAAEKKGARATSEGRISSYIHAGGKVGVMVEVACETDFVARNEEFEALVNDLCLHICAMNPLAVRREEVDSDLVEKEKAFFVEQLQDKPEQIRGKILEGKMNKWFSDQVLLEQSFVKDDKLTIQDLVTERIAKLGENIIVRRFVRLQLGEDISN